jgi:hypothetical protein
VICQSFKLSVVPYLFDSDEGLDVDLGSSLNVVGNIKKAMFVFKNYMKIHSPVNQVIVTLNHS